jgi:pimeloyl-ACP methyl ester carboxylesterase
VEFTIDTRDLRFRVVQWGLGRNPILLLHGLFGPVESFDLLVDTYSGERPLVAFDQRGHGHSVDAVDGYDIPTMAEDAAAVIRELGGPLDVVGHSMGAAVGITLAARHHGMVRRLILCEPPIDDTPEGEISRLIRDAPASFPSSEAGVAYQMSIQTDLTEERALKRLRHTPNGKWVWKVSIPGLRKLVDCSQVGSFVGFDPWLDAPLINSPTLVVRGSESAVFLRETLDRLVEAIPPAEGLHIAEVGHGVPYHKPHVLAAIMRGFLPPGG